MMNDSLIKIVRKFLIGNIFDIGGFEYKFLSVEPSEFYDKTAFKFVVNVNTPVKGQSYVIAKFDGDIQNILINLWKYFGTEFSYSIDEIMVNGVSVPENEVFISKEKQKELINRINFEFHRVHLSTKEINIDFKTNFKISEYYLSDVNITFDFSVEISDIKSEGKSIYPNIDTIDDLAGAIMDELNDDDDLRNNLEEVVFDVLEPEIKIIEIDDLFYNVNCYPTKIDGIEVRANNWGGYIEKEYFT